MYSQYETTKLFTSLLTYHLRKGLPYQEDQAVLRSKWLGARAITRMSDAEVDALLKKEHAASGCDERESVLE